MWIIRGFLDRLLLVCAVIAGGLVPGFIAQYRQRLGGRLDQARLDLKPWRELADHLFGGDLDKLIQHHLDSTDPTFHADGAIIRSLLATEQQLESAVQGLNGSLLHQAHYLLVHADPGLLRATFGDWVPTFALSSDGLVFALTFAVAVWALFHALWWLIVQCARQLRGGPKLSTRRPQPLP